MMLEKYPSTVENTNLTNHIEKDCAQYVLNKIDTLQEIFDTQTRTILLGIRSEASIDRVYGLEE